MYSVTQQKCTEILLLERSYFNMSSTMGLCHIGAKLLSHQYRKLHHNKNKMVSQHSFLSNGNPYTWKEHLYIETRSSFLRHVVSLLSFFIASDLDSEPNACGYKKKFSCHIQIQWNDNMRENPRWQANITTQLNEWFYTLRLEHNGWNFANNIFRSIFSTENICILIKMLLKFVPWVHIDKN